MRTEEDATVLFKYSGELVGVVTYAEFDYLNYLSEKNLGAFMDLIEGRYDGSIRKALAEKYGLPEGSIIPESDRISNTIVGSHEGEWTMGIKEISDPWEKALLAIRGQWGQIIQWFATPLGFTIFTTIMYCVAVSFGMVFSKRLFPKDN